MFDNGSALASDTPLVPDALRAWWAVEDAATGTAPDVKDDGFPAMWDDLERFAAAERARGRRSERELVRRDRPANRAGQDRADQGLAVQGPADQGLADQAPADDGLLEQGLVDQGLVDQGLVEQGLVDRGLVEQGLVEQGLVDRATSVATAIVDLGDAIRAGRAMVPDADLLRLLDAVQRIANAVPAVDAVVVGELDARGTAQQIGTPSTAALVRHRCRVRPKEATARVRAAAATAARRSLAGETLPPARPHLAAAQRHGQVTLDQATTIDGFLRRLPDRVDPAAVDVVEAALVRLAETADPTVLAVAGRHALDVLDPDGAAPRDADLDRARHLAIAERGDGTGMGRIAGELTPDLLVKLQTILHTLAAPRPAAPAGPEPDDGSPRRTEPDPRTAGQRLHDALEEVCDRLLRSGTLPDAGGAPLTVAVTIDLDQLKQYVGADHADAPGTACAGGTGGGTAAGETGGGATAGSATVLTEFGGVITVQRLLRAATEVDFVPVVVSKADGILGYGSTRRFATPAQAKALRARDRGCTFPHCDRPAAWTQRHHIVEAARGGPTHVDNLCLVCSWHHRHFRQTGWSVQMIDGRPWWIPPVSLDPGRTPLRNEFFDDVEAVQRDLLQPV